MRRSEQVMVLAVNTPCLGVGQDVPLRARLKSAVGRVAGLVGIVVFVRQLVDHPGEARTHFARRAGAKTL